MKINNSDKQANLFQKIITYLIKIQQVIKQVQIIILFIDIIQFATIEAFIIIQVYCHDQQKQLSQVLNPNFQIVFNYTNIYIGLVILGSILAIVFLACLTCFIIFFKTGSLFQNYPLLLKNSVIISAISIGLFQIIFQVMVNNLTNIFHSVLDRKSAINASILVFFLLNFFMMIFVSIFNSSHRIFSIFLVLISISINKTPLFVAYFIIFCFSVFFYRKQFHIFKKFLYFQLIITSLWGLLQILGESGSINFKNRIIYLSIASISSALIHLLKKIRNYSQNLSVQNQYLVELYGKKIKKQDKIQDYYFAEIYFNIYLQNSVLQDEVQKENNALKIIKSYDYYKHNVSQWPSQAFLFKLVQKISADAERQNTVSSIIESFQLRLDLGVKNISILKEVFQFISQKENENLYIKYLIFKLIIKIQSSFSETKGEEKMLKLNQILMLEQVYQSFYLCYDSCLLKLIDFYQNLKKFKGIISNEMQQNFIQFVKYNEKLNEEMILINQKSGNLVQNHLVQMLNQISSPYTKKQKATSNSKKQQNLNLSYLIIGNSKIHYASIKFMEQFHYNKDYIFKEDISSILPEKFDKYLQKKLKQNQQEVKFDLILPILNEFGLFNLFNVTFYLLPQLKGQIIYAMLISKIFIQKQKQNNLLIMNCNSFSIQYFNWQMVENFQLSLQKINFLIQTKSIQFEELFSSKNPQKQEIIYNSKTKQREEDQFKVIFKSSSISQFKKSVQEQVIINVHHKFQTQKTIYKILKVQSVSLKRKKGINQIKNNNISSSSLPVSVRQNFATKDLRKKYEEQTFFCKIANPYRLKILQKIQSLSKFRLTSNINIVLFFLFLIIVIFIGFSIAFAAIQKSKSSPIDLFKNQAQSLNTQYQALQNGIYHALSIYHLRKYNSSFVEFLKSQYKMNQTYAYQLVSESINYRLSEKDKQLRRFSQNFFDFPYLQGQQGISYTINFGSFQFQANSEMSTIFDLFTWLVEQSNPTILQLFLLNYNSYKKIAPYYLPSSRYKPKIQALNNNTFLLTIIYFVLSILITIAIFIVLYQIKDTKRDIFTIYSLINSNLIEKNISKLLLISKYLNKLRNKSEARNQSYQNLENKSDIESQDTINSLLTNQKRLSKNYSNVFNFDNQNFQQYRQEESQLFLQMKEEQQNNKKNQENIQNQKSQCLNHLLRVFLQNAVMLIFLFGIILFAYWFYTFSVSNGEQYILAFQFLSKTNTINIQYRLLTNTFYIYPFSMDIFGAPYVDSDPVILTSQGTQSNYQTPSSFSKIINHNICAQQNIAEVLNPLIKWQNCSTVDFNIFQQQFSQAYSVYQLNIKTLSNQTYSKLLGDSSFNSIFFSLIYQYEAFQSYLHQIINNFGINLQQLHSQISNKVSIFLGIMVGYLLIGLIVLYKKSIRQSINESYLMIQLIKMIPQQVLFSMKTTYFFKKKNVLQKLDRL